VFWKTLFFAYTAHIECGSKQGGWRCYVEDMLFGARSVKRGRQKTYNHSVKTSHRKCFVPRPDTNSIPCAARQNRRSRECQKKGGKRGSKINLVKEGKGKEWRRGFYEK